MTNNIDLDRIYGNMISMISMLALSLDALKKQISKTPKIGCDDTNREFCPICGIVLTPYDNYCVNCGQKIDWSEDNDN